MMETYDAQKGSKAMEQLARAEAYLAKIEEGQRQARIVEQKMRQRIENAND
jgi:hypothetical protein